MANNQQLASDNFASGSLAAGWSAVPGQSVCQVVTGPPNFTEANVVGTVAGQIWTGLTWPNDHASEVTITMTGSAVATTLLQLHVRNQGGGSYSGYRAIVKDSGAWEIDVVTAGTPTSLTSGTGLTIAASDVWTFQAAGSCLTLYQNFKLVGYVADTTYTLGSPGYSQQATTTLSTNEVFSWRGYSAVQQDGIWQKQGISIPAFAADFTGGGRGVATTSQVLYEGNAQILSGTVYKIWFCGQQPVASNAGGNIGYAESLDGITWSRYSPYVLNGYVSPSIWKVGSTYYMFAQPITGFGTAPYAVFTSTNGISWTLQNASGVGRGTSGAWDDNTIFGCCVVAIISGTWYALYYGTGTGLSGSNGPATGLATSSDGITWSKYAGNPVVKSFGMQQAIYTQDNSTFYVWGGTTNSGRGGADPFDPAQSVRYTVTNGFTTWANKTPGFTCAQGYEFVNSPIGQTWLNAVIVINGKTYGWTTSGNDGLAPLLYGVSLVTAPSSLTSIVQFPENAASQIASDNFSYGAGPLSSNWTPAGSAFNGSLHVVSGNIVEATAVNQDAASFYTGASFSPNQYSEITVQAVSGTNLITPMVRGSVGTGFSYWATITGPVGTADTICHIQRFNGSVSNIGPNVQITTQVGDVLRLQIITGSDGFPVLSLFQNGYLILQVQDQLPNPVTTGNPGMYINVIGSVANSQISQWAGGNANVVPNYFSSIADDRFIQQLTTQMNHLDQI